MPRLGLTGTQYADLTAAIQSALPAPSDLEQMLKFKLGKSLATYAPVGAAYPYIIFKVIESAEAQAWSAQLVTALRETTPENPQVFSIAQDVALSAMPRQLERQIRERSPYFDLVPLRTALARLEMQVCRIEIRVPGHGRALSGTGFLVGPDIVMTNHHVLEPVIAGHVKPDQVTVLFDHKHLESGVVNPGAPFKLAPGDWLIDASPPSAVDSLVDPGEQLPAQDELDYVAVRLESRPGAAAIGTPIVGLPTPTRGWITPPLYAAASEPGEPLFVLQHPEGNPLKLALEMDGTLVTNANGTRMRHKVNTDPGSSGSPCFNRSLELVAIHHSGDPNFFQRARYNEAIPFNSIVALVTARGKKAQVFGPWN